MQFAGRNTKTKTRQLKKPSHYLQNKMYVTRKWVVTKKNAQPFCNIKHKKRKTKLQKQNPHTDIQRHTYKHTEIA